MANKEKIKEEESEDMVEVKFKGKIPVENFDDKALLLNLKRRFDEIYKPKDAKATVPTHTPKNFLDQFYIYENGATLRLYVYISDSWHYVALT